MEFFLNDLYNLEKGKFIIMHVWLNEDKGAVMKVIFLRYCILVWLNFPISLKVVHLILKNDACMFIDR